MSKMLSGVFSNGKMKKLALFDFCETLISFQTADVFVDYVRQKEGNLYMKFLNTFLVALRKAKVIAILNKLFPYSGISKRIKLLQLKGFTNVRLDSLAESYYQDLIKPNLIAPITKEMNRLIGKNYEVCIVSAGYSLYLKYFTEDYNIKHLIATEIEFDKIGTRCLGRISGKDCIHNQKINRINSYFNGQKIDYKKSISYSDSITDLPLLSMTGQGVVVSRTRSQSWSHLYKFKEIIWT